MKKQTFGQRLRDLREAAGLSQTELAKRAETGRPYLNRLEHGTQNPSLDVLQRLADALKVPVEDMVKCLERSKP